MAAVVGNAYASKKKCQWCSRQTDRIEQMQHCNDQICDRCYIKDAQSKSKCPICWEKNISQFLIFNKICPVCCCGIKPTDKSEICGQRHPHCSDCAPKGCNLCRFRRIQAANDQLDPIPSPSKQAFYHCSQWQLQCEKNPLTFGPSKSKPNKSSEKTSNEEDKCIICLEELGSSYKTLEHCQHSFHEPCVEQWFKSSGKQCCPTCGYVYGIGKGPQPENGQMHINYIPTLLPGFENDYYKEKKRCTVEIVYVFPNGIQGPLNPHPGKPYTGTTRRAYLPNNKEGSQILNLLRKAFDDRYTFTIGKSVTSGQENVVTWNDIHHKTSIHGGPQNFGYPDPTYLTRVREELADKGYK